MITLGVTIQWEKSFVYKRDPETDTVKTIQFSSSDHSLLSGLGSMFTDEGSIYETDLCHSDNYEFCVGFSQDFDEDYVVDERTLYLPFIYAPHNCVYPTEEELKEKLSDFVRSYLDGIFRIISLDDMIDSEVFSKYKIMSINTCWTKYVDLGDNNLRDVVKNMYMYVDAKPARASALRLNSILYAQPDFSLPISLQKNKRFIDEITLLKSVENDFYRGVPTAYITEEENLNIIAKQIADLMIDKKLLLSKQMIDLDIVQPRMQNTSRQLNHIVYADGNVCFIRVGKVVETANSFDVDGDFLITKKQLKSLLTGNKIASRNGLIRDNIKDTLVFFVVKSKATEDTLLKVCEEVHFNVKTLCPDAFTDKTEIKNVFDEYAKKDHFNEYTGEVRNSPYMISEIRQEYESWKREKLFEVVGGKPNKAIVEKVDYDCLGKLNNLIGLDDVKKSVTKIINSFRMQKLYKEKGIINETPSRHMVFYGSPGTAKTTVARLIGDILNLEGILPSGQFVEVGREDLIGEYVGQTAPKTKKAFERAKGGILFIDEAYSLMTKDFYGAECIATIVKEMENNREDTIVIFAGYQDKMKDFVDFNEGMKSRIAFHLKFDDYTVDELMEINDKILKEQKFSMDEKALEKTRKLITSRIGSKNFGNGRFVRSLIEQSIMNLSDRLVKAEESVSNMSIETLTTITKEDIADMSEIDKVQHNIGFGSIS